MASPANTAEGGSNTTAVTTANSGGVSGDAWQLVTASATCSLTFDNTHAAHGALAYKVLLGATAGESYGEWSTSLTAAATAGPLYARAYLYFTANPTIAVNPFRWLSTTTLRGLVQITTAGKIAVLNSAGTAVGTSSASIPLNQWFRLEASIVGSATAGQIIARLYNTADSTAVTETITSAATINTGGTIDRCRYGHAGTGSSNLTFWMDDIAGSDVTWPGPSLITPPPPVRVQNRSALIRASSF